MIGLKKVHVGVPWHWRKQSTSSKKRVTLPALSLHLTALVSQYHLFIESTRDMLRADGAPTAAPLTSQQGPVPVCSEPHMLQGALDVWSACLAPHTANLPQEQAGLVLVRACDHWSHSQQHQQMEFFSTAAHEHSNFTHTGFGASLQVLNQCSRDLQHEP